MRCTTSNGSAAPENTCHRLKAAREREGLTLRAAARRMNISVGTARAEEEGETELSVSDLYRWQRALKVPLSDLLEPPSTDLSEPIRQRACLIRLVKTAKTLMKECVEETQHHRLANRMVNQLEQLMPELKEVGSWPEGTPRTLHELGRAANFGLPEDWFATPRLD